MTVLIESCDAAKILVERLIDQVDTAHRDLAGAVAREVQMQLASLQPLPECVLWRWKDNSFESSDFNEFRSYVAEVRMTLGSSIDLGNQNAVELDRISGRVARLEGYQLEGREDDQLEGRVARLEARSEALKQLEAKRGDNICPTDCSGAD